VEDCLLFKAMIYLDAENCRATRNYVVGNQADVAREAAIVCHGDHSEIKGNRVISCVSENLIRAHAAHCTVADNWVLDMSSDNVFPELDDVEWAQVADVLGDSAYELDGSNNIFENNHVYLCELETAAIRCTNSADRSLISGNVVSAASVVVTGGAGILVPATCDRVRVVDNEVELTGGAHGIHYNGRWGLVCQNTVELSSGSAVGEITLDSSSQDSIAVNNVMTNGVGLVDNGTGNVVTPNIAV
jgi:hypothetical protein